jgi:hypothetical protein
VNTVYTEDDLKAIVIGDDRLQRLVPAYTRLHASTSFERFRTILEKDPNASQKQLLWEWARSIDTDSKVYASQLSDHYEVLHDDLMCGAHFCHRKTRTTCLSKLGCILRAMKKGNHCGLQQVTARGRLSSLRFVDYPLEGY